MLDTTHNDYASNAAGKITSQQREALIERYDRSVLVIASWFGLMALGGIGVYILVLGGDESATTSAWESALVVAFLVSFAGMIWGIDFVKKRYTLPAVDRLLMSQSPKLGNGTLEWNGKRLMGHINGRWYRYIYDDSVSSTLTSGLYSGYYLDNPNWLLSIKRLDHMPETLHDEVLNRSIAHVNRFDSAALSRNRAGWLSLRQRRGVFAQMLRGGVEVISTLIPLLFIVGWVLLITFLVGRSGTEDLSLTLPPSFSEFRSDEQSQAILFVIIFVVFVFVLYVLWWFRRLAHFFGMLVVLAIGRNHRVEGEVHHDIRIEGDEEDICLCYYVVEGRYFLVPPAALDVLPAGRRVRAYYLPPRQFHDDLFPLKTLSIKSPAARRKRKRSTIKHHALVNLEVL